MLRKWKNRILYFSLFGMSISAFSTITHAAVCTKDFEDRKIEYVSGNAPTIVQAPHRSGRYAIKTLLNRSTSPVSYRTEMQFSKCMQVMPGQEYWYGFSIFLPTNYVSDSLWEIVAQWHSSPDPAEADGGLNPPVALQTTNGVWTVLTRWDSKPITVRPDYEGSNRYTLGAYATGKWTDWVFRIKWSPYQDGIIQVWKDGQKVIDKAGPIGYNDAIGPYFKMGLYKDWKDRVNPTGVVSERILYHDELRIAGPNGSYADVAPGGGLAEPSPPASLTVH
ncbi:MAG TPA: polysaccharide lyase [Gammaproteobacteria bacterium]